MTILMAQYINLYTTLNFPSRLVASDGFRWLLMASDGF